MSLLTPVTVIELGDPEDKLVEEEVLKDMNCLKKKAEVEIGAAVFAAKADCVDGSTVVEVKRIKKKLNLLAVEEKLIQLAIYKLAFKAERALLILVIDGRPVTVDVTEHMPEVEQIVKEAVAAALQKKAAYKHMLCKDCVYQRLCVHAPTPGRIHHPRLFEIAQKIVNELQK